MFSCMQSEKNGIAVTMRGAKLLFPCIFGRILKCGSYVPIGRGNTRVAPAPILVWVFIGGWKPKCYDRDPAIPYPAAPAVLR